MLEQELDDIKINDITDEFFVTDLIDHVDHTPAAQLAENTYPSANMVEITTPSTAVPITHDEQPKLFHTGILNASPVSSEADNKQ